MAAKGPGVGDNIRTMKAGKRKGLAERGKGVGAGKKKRGAAAPPPKQVQKSGRGTTQPPTKTRKTTTKSTDAEAKTKATPPCPKKQKSKTSEHVPRCPIGHELYQFDLADGSTVSCDVCQKAQPSGSMVWGCEKCEDPDDYDICQACAGKKRKKSVQRA